MADAAAADNAKERLIERLQTIFSHRTANEISTIVNARCGQLLPAVINEAFDALMNHCIDDLIFAPGAGAEVLVPAVNVENSITVASSDDSSSAESPQAGPSRTVARPGTPALDSPASSSLDSSTADESFNDQRGAPVREEARAMEAALRVEEEVRSITDIFPWVEKNWLRQQVTSGNYNKDALIERVLHKPSDIPKENKRKAASETPAAPAAAAAESAKPVAAIEYLTAYATRTISPAMREFANAYLSKQFPRIYLASIRDVLSLYKYNLAPAYKALRDQIRKVDLNAVRGSHFPAVFDIIGRGQVNLAVRVTIAPRTGRKTMLIPPEMRDEMLFIQNHIEQPQDAQASVDDPAASDGPETKRRRLIEEARERGGVCECGICYDEYLISEEMIACGDGHLFCVTCLRSHAKEAVYGQTKSDLSCMDNNCKELFPRAMLEKALDAELLKKLDERRTLENINVAEIEGLERCRYCNFAIVFEDSPKKNKVFKCRNEECEREYCRLCSVDWDEHVGKPCKEVESTDDTQMRREAEEKMAAAVIRNCSKCKAPLIKDEGCNKLICACGTAMCYICRVTIADYNHFCRHTRDPGHPCTQCKLCYLWEDPRKRDDAAVKSIQEETAAVLAKTGKALKVGVDEKNVPPQPVPAAAAAALAAAQAAAAHAHRVRFQPFVGGNVVLPQGADVRIRMGGGNIEIAGNFQGYQVQMQPGGFPGVVPNVNFAQYPNPGFRPPVFHAGYGNGIFRNPAPGPQRPNPPRAPRPPPPNA